MFLKVIIFAVLFNWNSAEYLGQQQLEQFCHDDNRISVKTCECRNLPDYQNTLHIDCSYRRLVEKDLPTNLPANVHTLVMSWNMLQEIPPIYSDSLAYLSYMHNNITIVKQRSFADTPNLTQLYLNWNSIQSIEVGAFDELKKLEILEISHNNLQVLPAQLFSPLATLTRLNLAWNRELGRTSALDVPYKMFGLHEEVLTHLDMEVCGLKSLVLPENTALLSLNLRGNQMSWVSEYLPQTLQKLDLSGNLMISLGANSFRHLENLEELLLEDMPELEAVDEYTFNRTFALRKLSFKNSRRLIHFDGNALANNVSSQGMSDLRYLSFRGTNLHTLDGTDNMRRVLANLQSLDLQGVPLQCDCNLAWLKELDIFVEGVCLQPSRLRGLEISSLPPTEFDCRNWPEWMYGMMILGIILFISVGLYFLITICRPHRGVTLRNKIGVGSPYARVTIQPNNQEYNHF